MYIPCALADEKIPDAENEEGKLIRYVMLHQVRDSEQRDLQKIKGSDHEQREGCKRD